ncbi:MAG: hypothetical protein GVY19_09550 [Bacteroidetes bacterium]|jgi:hypothetical protein|nr:hypothetical protein [Bacteroidota bacterium]
MAGTFEKIRTNIGYRQLKKLNALKKNMHEIVNLEDARKIGVVFNATHSVNFDVIRQFVKKLTKQKKEISILGYVHSKKIIDHYLYRKGFDFFTRKDLNWHYKPKDEAINDFVKQSFDILINLSLEDYLPIQYVLVRSNARFKVSCYFENAQFADMFIDINKNREEFESIRKEISSEHKMVEEELEHDIDEKTISEIQLNFLIEQVLHYLSLIKVKK